jgi:hypothetical protein
MSKSNKYGYVVPPEQSFGNNKGVFDPAEINELVADNKWTQFGQLELIETKNVSASSSAIFTDIKESTYNVHFLTVNDYAPSTDGTALACRFFENGVEESAAVYQYGLQYGCPNVSVGFNEEKSTGVAQFYLTASAGNGTNEVGNSYTYFYNLGNSSKYSFTTNQSTVTRPATDYIFTFGSSVLPQASTVDQIKCFVTSGTYSADISLYGIRYS